MLSTGNINQRNRQNWMAVLAQAEPTQLKSCVETLGTLPDYQQLRPPETGLTMVRGRAGGTGQMFNLGEMTLTRCVIVIDRDRQPAPSLKQPSTLSEPPSGDLMGFGYVAGRSHEHAECAAVCDALLQDPHWHPRVYRQVIVPLEAVATDRQRQMQEETAATKVDFFTLLRGE